jgi:hypothetical protein
MAGFGIRFSGEIRGTVETPVGFCASEISLGDHKEICFSDCSKWNPGNYVEHWRLSAKELVNDNAPKLFCSSLETMNAALWIGIPKGDIVLFYNRISKASDLKIDKLTISPKKSFSEFIGKPSPKWSCWEVPLANLKRLADGK